MEMFFWPALCLAGFFWGKYVFRLPENYSLILSLPFGLGFSSFFSLLIITIGLNIPIYYSLIIPFIIAIYCFYKYPNSESSSNIFFITKSIVFCFIIFLVNYLLNSYNLAAYTSDSFVYDGIGRVIAISARFDATINTEVNDLLFMKPPMSSLLHALGYSYGIESLFTLYPFVSLFTLMGLIYFSFIIGKEHFNVKLPILILTAILGSLLLISPNYIYHTFFALPNLLASMYFSLGLYCTILYKYNQKYFTKEYSQNPLLLSIGALLGFAYLTNPTMGFLNLLPILFIATDRDTIPQLSLSYLPISYIWPVFQLLQGRIPAPYGFHGYDLLTLLSYLIVMYFAPKIYLRWGYDLLVKGLFLALSAILLFCVIVFPQNFFAMLSNLLSLMFYTGDWGAFWYIATTMVMLFICFSKIKYKEIFVIFIYGFFIVRFLIYSVTRDKLGIDHTSISSGNRILLFIAPFIIFYININLIKLSSSLKRKDT